MSIRKSILELNFSDTHKSSSFIQVRARDLISQKSLYLYFSKNSSLYNTMWNYSSKKDRDTNHIMFFSYNPRDGSRVQQLCPEEIEMLKEKYAEYLI